MIFFANIGSNLAKKIQGSEKHFTEFLGENHGNSIFLNPTTRNEMIEILKSLKNKASLDKDDLNMEFIKHIISTIQNP